MNRLNHELIQIMNNCCKGLNDLFIVNLGLNPLSTLIKLLIFYWCDLKESHSDSIHLKESGKNNIFEEFIHVFSEIVPTLL